MIELTISDMHRMLALATALNGSEGTEISVPLHVGTNDNRRVARVHGHGVRFDPSETLEDLDSNLEPPVE